MQVKKQQLEPDMEHQTDSKLGKGYIKAVYCYAAYLTCLEKEMTTHSSILAWKIPWMEEPGRLYIVHGLAKSQTRLSDFTFLSFSCEMLGWMKHKLESKLLGEISITSDMQMTPLL